MDYYYETEGLQKCITETGESMLKAYDRDDLPDKVARSVIRSFITRLRCEISYQGFRGLLVSEEQVWEKVQDREVGQMLDEQAKVYEGPLTEAFRKGLFGSFDRKDAKDPKLADLLDSIPDDGEEKE